ncbi:hypothetical protein E4U16_005217 [Claviceps sp. LM84 group G4]|nr:hypothetical protein E4U33_004901 [Claviceps sp. LM78 group G4]KAG6072623.1 hypothetical protein E4U16_005217 [Claviceps sp. LM84 group G4]
MPRVPALRLRGSLSTQPVAPSIVKHAITGLRGIHSTEAESVERETYINKHGEEIFFRGESAPPGYRFLPAGSHYLTRHCRILANKQRVKLYALYLPRIKTVTSKSPFTVFANAGQSGLYVPERILATVTSQYEKIIDRRDMKVVRIVNRNYPRMPSEDKAEFRKRCSSPLVRPLSENDIASLARRYARDRYTAFLSLSRSEGNKKAREEACREAAQIASSWCGP